MKNFNKKKLEGHLKSLGIEYGDNLVVHSKLISFGRVNKNIIPKMITDIILKMIGTSGTLAFPSYIFGDQGIFYPKSTDSTKVGILGNYLRGVEGSVRSNCPIHNHTSIGLTAEKLSGSIVTSSIGEKSDFEFFQKNNFKLILLGCSFSEGCTFAHHMEAMLNVPYRHWTTVVKKVYNSEKDLVENIKVNYFGRKNNLFKENFSILQKDLLDANLVKLSELPYGKSFSIPLPILADFISQKVKINPYYLVKKHG